MTKTEDIQKLYDAQKAIVIQKETLGNAFIEERRVELEKVFKEKLPYEFSLQFFTDRILLTVPRLTSSWTYDINLYMREKHSEEKVTPELSWHGSSCTIEETDSLVYLCIVGKLAEDLYGSKELLSLCLTKRDEVIAYKKEHQINEASSLLYRFERALDDAVEEEKKEKALETVKINNIFRSTQRNKIGSCSLRKDSLIKIESVKRKTANIISGTKNEKEEVSWYGSFNVSIEELVSYIKHNYIVLEA